MKNSMAPKIVIAAGLALVYGTGLAMVTLHKAPGKNVAQNAVVAPTTQTAAEPVLPATASASTDASTIVVAQPAAMTEVPAPVSSAKAQKNLSVATGSPAERSEAEKPGPTSEAAGAVNEPATSTVDAPSSEHAESVSSGNDSQIVADVGT